MRDPRLAEIEFLMDIERADHLALRSTSSEESSGSISSNGSDARNLYGLSVGRFRDMVLHFILNEYVVGPIRRSNDTGINEAVLEAERLDLTGRLEAGQMLTFSLSHAGRVHLWSERDALMKDPDLEPFGLRSRAAWDRDLFLRLQFATRRSPLAVIFLDLDNFGAVNKTLGAPIGDAVLRVVFGLVKNIVGTRGAAYRYGGEEVGVLMPGIDKARAAELAEELRVTIERDTHAQVSQLSGPQTASIGVETFDGPLPNDAAVAKVDELMRVAKNEGKNRVAIAR